MTSEIIDLPDSPIEIRTSGKSETHLTFRKRLYHEEGKRLDTPRRAIPIGQLYDDDQLPESVWGANEHYKRLTRSDLRSFEGNEPIRFQKLESSLSISREQDFDFTFLEYDSDVQISRVTAYQLVDILDWASDYLTVPLQPRLYSEIDPDNGLDDFWFELYSDGVELFLQACHDHETNKPIMGAIPPLEIEYVKELINLYELYDVFAFYFDYNWTLPNRPSQIARTAFLMNRVAEQGLHRDVLTYALNARRGKLDGNTGFYPAADFTPILCGVDIIGENYSGPDWPPEVFESLEPHGGFWTYIRGIMGYIRPSIEQVKKHISNDANEYSETDEIKEPIETKLDVDTLVRKSKRNDDVKRRWEKLYTAEQQGKDLIQLRTALENGKVEDYLDKRNISEEILDASESVLGSFEEGLEEAQQSAIGDWHDD